MQRVKFCLPLRRMSSTCVISMYKMISDANIYFDFFVVFVSPAINARQLDQGKISYFALHLRGGMAPSGVIFHENVNFLFVAQKCQVIHVFHKIHKQNMIPVIETHNLGNFINDMVFGDQRVSTKKRRWWAAFSSIFWNIYSQYRMPFIIGI